MTPEQRDELAQALYATDKAPGSREWLEWDEHCESVKDIWRGYADRLAESDWMKERLAEAWDAGVRHMHESPDVWDRVWALEFYADDNPYRTGESGDNQ